MGTYTESWWQYAESNQADAAGNSYHTSSFWLSDASFLKISNVTEYAVPDNICQKTEDERLEVYGSVENLHTFPTIRGEVDVTDQGMCPAR